MLRGLRDELTAAQGAPDIRGAVITGAGAVFCAGADLAEIATRTAEDALSLLSRDVFDMLSAAPWPTIAAVNGPAVGGGFELALACDLRVCAEGAFFQLPEPGFGLIAAAGGIRRLAAELGAARAKELVLFARKLDAATALSWGLAARVTERTVEAAIELVETAGRLDPLAVRAAKLLIDDRFETRRGQGAEALAQALLYTRRAAKAVQP